MLRKIFPASMLSVLIILTLASCSGSTPVPAADEVTVQPERPQVPSSPVMAKLSRAAELLAAQKKDESGYAVLKSDLTASLSKKGLITGKTVTVRVKRLLLLSTLRTERQSGFQIHLH